MLFSKCTLHDFPAFALFSHTIIKMSEGTFCRVEVHKVKRGKSGVGIKVIKSEKGLVSIRGFSWDLNILIIFWAQITT